jgi:glycosyltransferase involved in cell wall biosynthesis
MESIDVVVPSYQYGHLLNECITSVLTQGIAELRVLVIDNASSDNSVEVARQLAAQDSRVEVVARRTNLGPHASFNEGIDWARGDYFLVLCADDLLVPGALRRAIFLMEQQPDVHLAYGAVLSVRLTEPLPALGNADGDGQWRILPGMELLEKFCSTGRNHIPGPTAVVRTSVQKRVGYYRKELTHTDDFEMWMRFACQGNVAETACAQGIARTHAANQSAMVPNIHVWDIEYEAAFISFFAREGLMLRDSRRLLHRARRSLGERAYWCAFSHFCRGETRIATDLLKFAWRTSPRTMVIPPIGHLCRRADAPDRIVRALNDVGGRLLKYRA